MGGDTVGRGLSTCATVTREASEPSRANQPHSGLGDPRLFLIRMGGPQSSHLESSPERVSGRKGGSPGGCCGAEPLPPGAQEPVSLVRLFRSVQTHVTVP